MIRTKTSNATSMRDPTRARYSRLDNQLVGVRIYLYCTHQNSLPMKGTLAMVVETIQRCYSRSSCVSNAIDRSASVGHGVRQCNLTSSRGG